MEDIAPKYFNLDDITKLRVGLFGYVNEIESNGLEDSVNMMNILSNEIFPNKAILPNSIYSYAALGDFEDFNAKPAKLSFSLILRKEDLIANSVEKNGYREYFISRYSTLTIENDVQFMLDYDIVIKIKKTNDGKDWILSARYNFDIKNALSDIVNPYITSMVLEQEKEEYMYLNLTAKQLERQEYTFNIATNDLVENIKFDVDFTGTIAGFNIFYIPPNSNQKIQLTKYYVDSIKPEEQYFCFYQYNTATQFSILFSAHPDYFRPEFNSNLMIEVYTTKGKDGNFVYDGENIEFVFYKNDYDEIGRVLHYAFLIGNSQGGEDSMTLEEIKYNAVKAFSVRKNIISDNDLDYYFKGITKNCKMQFVKKRDDVIKRIYSAFLLLKDVDNNIIPTNTLDLFLNKEDIDNYNPAASIYSIKPGKILEYQGKEDDVDVYHFNNDIDINYVSEHESVNNFYYTTPYLMKINTDPHFVSYYLNSVFADHGCIFKDMNPDVIDEYIITYFSMYRNALKSDYYTFTFKLNTNCNKDELIQNDANGNFIGLYDNIKIKIFLRHKTEYIGYFDCYPTGISDNGLFIDFEGKIRTSDYMNENDQISIVNSIYKVQTKLNILMEECPIPADEVYADIAVFSSIYDNTDKLSLRTVYNPNDMKDYCLCTLYTSEEEISLFKDINNIEISTLVLKDSQDNISYKIKSVPLFRYSYMYDDNNLKEVISLLDYFRESMQDTLQLIENNFDIDMKFYNTYGKSKYFVIGRNGERLDSISISINLTIKINVDLTDIIKNDIESFIIKYVEAVNETEENNYLYISNLFQALENEFEYIIYVEFDGFNECSSDLQVIDNEAKNFNEMTTQQIIKYVPEYLNVNRRSSIDGESIKFIPDIYIEYI